MYCILWVGTHLDYLQNNMPSKTGTHPKNTTEDNIKNFKRQIQMLGFSYDWDREINTTDEKYYKWTQWIFLQLYKKGLAYEARGARIGVQN